MLYDSAGTGFRFLVVPQSICVFGTYLEFQLKRQHILLLSSNISQNNGQYLTQDIVASLLKALSYDSTSLFYALSETVPSCEITSSPHLVGETLCLYGSDMQREEVSSCNKASH